MASLLLAWSIPLLALGATPPLLLGPGLLLLGRRVYPEGFLWLAFLPGFLHANEAGWPLLWAKTSLALLLFGLYLSREKGFWATLWLLPLALALGPWGLGLWGLLHGSTSWPGRKGWRSGPFFPFSSPLWGSGSATFPCRASPSPRFPPPPRLPSGQAPGKAGGQGGAWSTCPRKGAFPSGWRFWTGPWPWPSPWPSSSSFSSSCSFGGERSAPGRA